jgi:hypothetical protein
MPSFPRMRTLIFFASLLFVTALALRSRLRHNHLGHNVELKMCAGYRGMMESIKEKLIFISLFRGLSSDQKFKVWDRFFPNTLVCA